MTWVIVSVIVLGLVFFYYRSPAATFWRIVARNPDDAYDWFLADPAWEVQYSSDPRAPSPANQWTGPFSVWVPMLDGERIKVYGRRDRIRASQAEFLKRYGKAPSAGMLARFTLRIRYYNRLGAFTRLRKAGHTVDEARRLVDQMYPLTAADRQFELEQSDK